jgi:hypothetical protein
VIAEPDLAMLAASGITPEHAWGLAHWLNLAHRNASSSGTTTVSGCRCGTSE